MGDDDEKLELKMARPLPLEVAPFEAARAEGWCDSGFLRVPFSKEETCRSSRRGVCGGGVAVRIGAGTSWFLGLGGGGGRPRLSGVGSAWGRERA